MATHLQRSVIIAVSVALALIVALWILQYAAIYRLRQDNQRVSHTEEVLESLMGIRTRLNRADASAQSFVITGENSYLIPYSKATSGIRERVDSLHTLTADNARQQERLDILAAQVNSSIRAFQNEIDAGKSGAIPADELLRMEESVRNANDGIRATIAEMEAEERDLLIQRNKAAQRANMQTIFLTLLASVSAFAFLAVAGVTLYSEISKRSKAEEGKIKAYEALQRTNQELKTEVAERKQAEINLHYSEQSLRELSNRLLRTQDEERRRIGRDLHDSLGQFLTVLKMGLNAATALLGQVEIQAAEKKLAECVDLTEECIKEARTVSYLLHPPMLEELGLQAAVPWYLEGFSKRSGIQTTLEIAPDFKRLPSDVELALFRVLQESLTNVHRHSESPVAHVRMLMKDGLVTIEVEDQGKGIAASSFGELKVSPSAVGVGLRSMNERMRQLGGNLEIYSGENRTIIRATVPIAQIIKTKTAA